jgi:hypothetical protein
MSEMTREEALAHFGVKGMRWGVRKDRESNGIKSVTYDKGQIVDTRFTKGSYPKTDAERKAFIEDFVKNTKNESDSFPSSSKTSSKVEFVDVSNSRPLGNTSGAKTIIFGMATTAIIGLGVAFAANQLLKSGGIPIEGFKRPNLNNPFKNKAFTPEASSRLHETATRVYETVSKGTIGGKTKAIEGLRFVEPTKQSVYDIVSDKNLRRSASAGKKFTEDVLIGTIGGISINDLKR